MTSGVRTVPSSTMPTRLPSTQMRSASCTSVAFNPSRPAFARSTLTVKYFWPALRSANTSVEPDIFLICAAISRPSLLSVGISSPKIFTTTSPRAPIIISCTRMSMGWAKANEIPGIGSRIFRISSSSHFMSLPRHVLRGFNVMNKSVSLMGAGSRPSSSAPARAMIRSISGIAAFSSF